MRINKNHATILRIIFALVGLLSLFKIIKNYGFHNVAHEVNQSGYQFFFLVFTFIPTLICYSISWLLISDHRRMLGEFSIIQKIYIYTKFTIASIAWNNLTPFLKVGGEPLKYMMLLNYFSPREALASTINYNIIHLLATGLSFVITSLILVVFYHMPNDVRIYLLSFAVLFSLLLYLGFLIMRSKFVYVDKTYRYRIVRVIIVNVKLTFRRLLNFYKKNPRIFFISLFVDIIARFIEGFTFYLGFYIIKYPITLLSSSLLDIGRTFVDTIFFFVPYQIGSREEGVHFFMEKILMIDSKGFLSAVLLYRMVEVIWIFIGYLIWVSHKRLFKGGSNAELSRFKRKE